jgi:hypothetical protein
MQETSCEWCESHEVSVETYQGHGTFCITCWPRYSGSLEVMRTWTPENAASE